MKNKVRICRNPPTGFFQSKLNLVSLLVAGLLAAVGMVRATDFYWTSSIGGDWSDTNNWTPPSVYPPGAQDNVFITAPGTYSVTNGGYVNSLTLGDGVGSFPKV